MSRLFIAEKPELAKAIASQVASSFTKNDETSYMEVGLYKLGS